MEIPKASGTGNSGLYWLRIDLARPARIVLRGSVRHRLPEGAYLYTGSARRNLLQRVTRHLRRGKPLRWHIDRLTTHRAARNLGAVLLPLDGASPGEFSECGLNALAGTLPGATTPLTGFGAGDCRAGCPAHLWRLEPPQTLEALAEVLARHLPPEAAPPRVFKAPRTR